MSESMTERNRAIVLDFIELFYHRRQAGLAFEKHVGDFRRGQASRAG